MNIPIYIAKKIDSDELVKGELVHDNNIYYITNNSYYSSIKRAVIARFAWEIDPSTLSISFDNGGTFDSIDDVKQAVDKDNK